MCVYGRGGLDSTLQRPPLAPQPPGRRPRLETGPEVPGSGQHGDCPEPGSGRTRWCPGGRRCPSSWARGGAGRPAHLHAVLEGGQRLGFVVLGQGPAHAAVPLVPLCAGAAGTSRSERGCALSGWTTSPRPTPRPPPPRPQTPARPPARRARQHIHFQAGGLDCQVSLGLVCKRGDIKHCSFNSQGGRGDRLTWRVEDSADGTVLCRSKGPTLPEGCADGEQSQVPLAGGGGGAVHRCWPRSRSRSPRLPLQFPTRPPSHSLIQSADIPPSPPGLAGSPEK